MPKPCVRCHGTGTYRQGHFVGFCYACKGRGTIVRKRRPSVHRLEQQLAALQDEKSRLEAATSPLEASEYERLLVDTERFFEPIAQFSGMPREASWAIGTSSAYDARTGVIVGAITVKSEAARKIDKTLERIKILGPLVTKKRARLISERESLSNEVRVLERFLDTMPSIASVLSRAHELYERKQRLQRIEAQAERLRADLSSASRQTEAKLESFRSRAKLTERENRDM